MEQITRVAERLDEPPEARKQRVSDLTKMVADDISHWEDDFNRMRHCRAFVRGLQWREQRLKDMTREDNPYTENFTLRHVKQRVASIYARNPRFRWKRSKRLHHKLWDGTAESLQAAIVGAEAGDPQAIAVLEEYGMSTQRQKMLKGVGETLTIAYEYSLREQIHPTKTMLKRMITSATTCGVGYVKQTFQRVMAADPDTERALSDARSQLETMNRIAQDIEDGETEPDSGEADRLRTMIAELEKQPQIPLREGLALDYPEPMNVIPSKEMTFINEFVGCPYVTERYYLTRERVSEVYGVDLGHNYTPYQPDNKEDNRNPVMRKSEGTANKEDRICVWEIWHKEDGLVYTIADGYDDYLRVEAPQPVTERFWPWFAYAPNWTDDCERPYPASDVELIMPMQREVNRGGDALSDHRYAARPSHVMPGASVEQDTLTKLAQRAAHSIQALSELPEDGDIRKFLQPFPNNPIDPNLYTSGNWLEGMLRVSGTQEANLGPTSNATATESAIAQSSRQSGDDSAIDELDELLTNMARAGGQILLQELDAATVTEIVGPGAVWPEANREEIAKEIYLEVEAGSSGRKNQSAEVQTATQMLPLMMQIPGLSPEYLVKHMLKVMDSNINFEEAISPGALSITAMNGQAQAQANASGKPEGGSGGNNAPTPEPETGTGPAPPQPSTPPV